MSSKVKEIASSRTSRQSCCVVGCSNKYANTKRQVKFYGFPTKSWDLERRRNWIHAINRKQSDGSSWEPTKHSVICSLHFVGNEKSMHPNSPSYLPTLFPEVYKKTQLPSSSNARFKRAEKRRAETRVTSPEGNLVKKRAIVDHDSTHDISEVEHPAPWPIKPQPCLQCACPGHSTTRDSSTQTDIMVVNKIIIANNPKVTQDIAEKKTMVDKEVNAVPTNTVNSSSFLVCQGFHGFQSIKVDNELLDLAGVSLNTFKLLLKILPDVNERKVTKNNRLLIFLMKMKIGLTYSALSVLFSVHRTTISVTFKTVLCQLACLTTRFTYWPSREAVNATMPAAFNNYQNCRVIIDCTEIKVEQPKEVNHRIVMYSNYKSTFTHKVLLGVTPNGSISFVSKAYGGRTSDSTITIDSDFIKLLEPGDVVLADKGFPGIRSSLEPNHVVIVMPPLLHNGRFTEEEVSETYQVASVRIHVERAIQRVKIYNILLKLPHELFPFVNEIVHMCCVLANLQPHIIKTDA